MKDGRRWTVHDRSANRIYLTEERWQHIIAPNNHPEMAAHEEQLKQTITTGTRRQDSLNPRKYRYTRASSGLDGDNTHIVAIVLFGMTEDSEGKPVPNNHITTAYQKEGRYSSHD